MSGLRTKQLVSRSIIELESVKCAKKLIILIYLTAKETHIIQYPFNTENLNQNFP